MMVDQSSKSKESVRLAFGLTNFLEKRGIVFVLLWFVLMASLFSFNTPINEGPAEITHIKWVIDWADGDPVAYTFYSRAPLYYIVNSGFLQVLTFNNPLDSPPIRFMNNIFFYFHGVEEDFPFADYAQTIHILRLLTIGFGAITVYFTYKIAQIFFKNNWYPLFAAFFITLIPKFTWLSGIINNDNLLITFSTISIFLLMRLIDKPSIKQVILLGIFVGLAIFAKTNGLLLLPLVGIVFALKLYQKRWTLQRFFKNSALVISTSLIGIWYPIFIFFNPYRGPSQGEGFHLLMGVSQQPQLLVGLSENPEFHPFARANEKLFDEFWMGLLHHDIMGPEELTMFYRIITVLFLISVILFFISRKSKIFSSYQKNALNILLISVSIMALAAFFVLLIGGFMARNAFPVLPEAIIIITLGIFYGTLFLKKYQRLVVGALLVALLVGNFTAYADFSNKVTSQKLITEEYFRTDDPIKNLLKTFRHNQALQQRYSEVNDGDLSRFNHWAVTSGVRMYPKLLGPDLEIYQALDLFYSNPEIQQKFPEVQNGNLTGLIEWRNMTLEKLSEKLIDSTPSFQKDDLVSYLLVQDKVAVLTNQLFFTIDNTKSNFDAVVPVSIKFINVDSREVLVPSRSILTGAIQVVDIEDLIVIQSIRGSFGIGTLGGTFTETDNLIQETPPALPADQIFGEIKVFIDG